MLAAFVAHGSSSIRLIIIEYLALWGSIGAVEGRFLVVAMSMERLEVPEVVGATESLWDNMVDFRQVSVSQIQSTGRASPFLLLEECSQSRPVSGLS